MVGGRRGPEEKNLAQEYLSCSSHTTRIGGVGAFPKCAPEHRLGYWRGGLRELLPSELHTAKERLSSRSGGNGGRVMKGSGRVQSYRPVTVGRPQSHRTNIPATIMSCS